MASELLAAGFSRMLKTDVVTRQEYERLKTQGIPENELPRKLTINDLFDYTYVSGPLGAAAECPTGEITVTGLTGKRVVIPVNEKTTIMDIKIAVFNDSKVSPDLQQLMYKENVLDDNSATLAAADIPYHSTIYMVILSAKSQTGLPFYFDESLLAPSWDYDFTGKSDAGQTFRRGGYVYERPCGWKRHAIKALGEYSDDVWLGSCNGPGEWPVSYHGASLSDVENIAESGYSLSKEVNFPHERGIYTTPSPVVAEKFSTEFTHNVQTYKMMLQNRQNPAPGRMVVIPSTRASAGGDYWAAADVSDLRPYAICIKRV